MTQLKVDDASFELGAGESVLDCLLRHGQAIPYACRSGVCQACLVKAADGLPPPAASQGLKPTLQAAGYALACQWRPESDVALRLPGATDAAVEVVIAALDPLNAGVLRVHLQPRAPNALFSCRPGQYLSLINPAGLTRSYSIANDPAREGHVELHVASTTHGEFTRWLFSEARPGQAVHVRGPAGACFYTAEGGRDGPLLLAGTGTGLAPLYGIVRDALQQGHAGPIHLIHGGSVPERLYYVDELRALAATHANFSYQPLALRASDDSRVPVGSVEDAVLQALDPATLPDTRVYLCGAPDFVHGLRRRVFLKGVRSARIFCDAFLTKAGAA